MFKYKVFFLAGIIASLSILSSCQARQIEVQKKKDIMSEEDRSRLMIQKDQDEENQKIMRDNLQNSQTDPLYMEQNRLDPESGKIIPDRMRYEEKE